MNPVITISGRLMNKIRQHCRQCYPDEACGFIAGVRGRAESVFVVENAAQDKRRGFLMHPQGQVDAMYAIKDAGQEILAVYHSHPNGRTCPSARDLAGDHNHAWYHVVVAMGGDGGVRYVNGFEISNSAATSVTIQQK